MIQRLYILLMCLMFSTILNATTTAGSAAQITSSPSNVANFEKKSDRQFTKNKKASARVKRQQIQRKRFSAAVGKTAATGTSAAQAISHREIEPLISANAYWFEFYDAHVFLNVDYDADGYFSKFTVRFDANVSGGYADVYAKLYLSLAGGAWVHYHTTDVFTIHAGDDDDDYSVTTRLRTDFPTGDYDVLIDLFEAGYPGIVASIGPREDADLYALPLEDNEHELGGNATLIENVSTQLFDDRDGDAFYTALSIEYDIDTLHPDRLVYAEIILTHSTDFWQDIITTTSFALHNQTELVEIDLDSGFDPAWYDAEIKIIDDYTGELLAVAAQDFASLTQIPLESIDYDNAIDRPSNQQPIVDASGSVSSSESGGGAFGVFALLIGIALLVTKRRKG